MIFPKGQSVLRNLLFSGTFPNGAIRPGFQVLPRGKPGIQLDLPWDSPGFQPSARALLPGDYQGKPGIYLDSRLPPGKLDFTRGQEFKFSADSGVLESWCSPGENLVFHGITTKNMVLPGFPSLPASKILSPTRIYLNSHRDPLFYPGIYQENPRFPHG